MTPNLNDMMVFLAVVDTQSFTEAARRLGRTRSAVSQSVSRLESDISTRLLYRNTRSLNLTEAGARFAAHCREIRRTHDSAISEIRESSDRPSGQITVTAPHALCNALLVPAMKSFLAENTNMRVRLFADDAHIDLIEASVDLAVRAGTAASQSARISKLGSLNVSLYASRAYLDSRGGIPDDPAALAQWDHIVNDWQGSPIRYRLHDGTEFSVLPRVRCNAFPSIIEATRQSLGVARLADLAVRASHMADELVAIMPLTETPVYTMHQFESRPPQKVKLFIDALRQHLS